jgi:hypothetical protein
MRECNGDMTRLGKSELFSTNFALILIILKVLELIHKVFDNNQLQNDNSLIYKPTIHITPSHVQVGHTLIDICE